MTRNLIHNPQILKEFPKHRITHDRLLHQIPKARIEGYYANILKAYNTLGSKGLSFYHKVEDVKDKKNKFVIPKKEDKKDYFLEEKKDRKFPM